MKYIKIFDKFLDEAKAKSADAKVEEFETTISGTDFMISATVKGTAEYDPGSDEEGHGYHKVGEGYDVDIEEIILDEVNIDTLGTYCKVELDKQTAKKIHDFLMKDKKFQKQAEEALIESLD
jgi:hypothetical protein